MPRRGRAVGSTGAAGPVGCVYVCRSPHSPTAVYGQRGPAGGAVRSGPVGGAGRGVPGAPGCFVTGVWSPPRPSVPPGRRGLRGRGLGRQAGGAGVGAGPPRIGQGAGGWLLLRRRGVKVSWRARVRAAAPGGGTGPGDGRTTHAHPGNRGPGGVPLSPWRG